MNFADRLIEAIETKQSCSVMGLDPDLALLPPEFKPGIAAGVSDRERRRLPATTWVRLQRTVEETETALLLVADGHVAFGPGGASLALVRTVLRWSSAPGPGRG